MKLIVYLESAEVEPEYRYILDQESFGITVNKEDNIKQLCQLEKIENCIREYFRERGYFYTHEDILKYLYSNYDLLQIECHDDNIHTEDIIHFIKNNDLKQFNKVLLLLDENKYNEIDKFLNQDFPENVVFKLPDNFSEISYEELIKTVNAVNNITDEVRDLSPLEQIMFLYDIIRDRVYCDDINDKMSARDLTSVLLGDKIVCLGYASIFHIALKKLGINITKEIIRENNSKKGHARDMVYISDFKYNVCAIASFDLTFDSKKEENDDSFLQSYKFFARPLSYFKKKEKNKYHSELIPFFDLEGEKQLETINNMCELDDIKNNDFLFSMMKIGKLCNKKIGIVNFIDWSTGRIDMDSVKNQYNEFTMLLETEIDPETFARCFVAVRQKQQQLSPERFHLDKDEVISITHNRYKPETTEEELLLTILGKSYFSEQDAKKIAKKVLGKNNQPNIQKQKS